MLVYAKVHFIGKENFSLPVRLKARMNLNSTEKIKMRKLQIILGIIGILLGCYTMVTAIMYLCGSITNLGFCMIGLAFCCVFNCFNSQRISLHTRW